MERVTDADALSAWENKLNSLGNAMCECSGECNWSEIDPLMQRYTELLHQPPAVERVRLAPAYQAAKTIIAQLQHAATLAHTATSDDIRRTGRGRKAVNAYR